MALSPAQISAAVSLHARGLTYAQIGEHPSVDADRNTVARVLKLHYSKMAERSQAARARVLAQHEAMLNEVRRAAWEAWQASTMDKVKVSEKRVGDVVVEERREVEGQAGNPAFLSVITKAAEQQRALLRIGEFEPVLKGGASDIDASDLRAEIEAALAEGTGATDRALPQPPGSVLAPGASPPVVGEHGAGGGSVSEPG